jgi:prepilin-type N-terminal cleavage/methylation domain-containing protein
MRRRTQAFTLIELLVVVAIIALLISILLPSLSRARELSKKLVCASNLKGIGTACAIYSNEHPDNFDLWPTPIFNEVAATGTNPTFVEYVSGTDQTIGLLGNYSAGTGGGDSNNKPPIGLDRTEQSTKDDTDGISPTRAFWMLVRTGDVTVNQFVCPSSGAIRDDTREIELYYDFQSIDNCSYGYQVPFGPRTVRASANLDPRMAVAADRGPYSDSTGNETVPLDIPVTEESPPTDWRQFNSPNHGGQGSGEGQNVLFADSHATFERTPTAGVDKDNIYTLQLWTEDDPSGRVSGESPVTQSGPYPGYLALDTKDSETDSLIWP